MARPVRALARDHNLVHYRETTIARSRDDAISLPARSGVPTKGQEAAAAASVASGQSPASQAANFSSTSTPSTDLASLTCHATGRRRAALSAYRARSAIQLLSTVKPSWTTWMRPDATPLSSTATATARFACSSAPAPALLIGQQGLQVCDAGVPRECGHRRPHSL